MEAGTELIEAKLDSSSLSVEHVEIMSTSFNTDKTIPYDMWFYRCECCFYLDDY